ncbi:hypothetical protein [Halobacillus ihumii]|uniref:hypothetical protein n=1 Tax=Halobacillus ihumii TaxID=2686092 RepID=UPI0013D1B2B2|nr:hypothetical protein [Halobacillus ihumii]
MDRKIKKCFQRKLIATIASTTIISFFFALFYILKEPNSTYNQGNKLIAWFFVYFVYIWAIILVYGNLVSAGIEHLQRKWFRNLDWLYVLILGVFGLVNGVFFQEMFLAYCGMAAAILYGIIDKWAHKRIRGNKRVRLILLIPVGALLISWGVLQISSPSLPPFTKEDAVGFATKGEGTVIDDFPQEIGQKVSNIGGYQVIKETSIEEIKEEVYLVKFTKQWSKGQEKGSRTLSYKVSRGSLTLKGSTGGSSPYYRNPQY